LPIVVFPKRHPLYADHIRPMPAATTVIETGQRVRLGELLCRRGDLSATQLSAALALQRQSQARLGEVLLSRGWIDRERLTAALAAQAGLDTATVTPRAAGAAPGAVDNLAVFLRRRLLPLPDADGPAAFVAADATQGAAGLREMTPPQGDARLSLADPDAVDAALLTAFGPALAQRGATRCAEADSARRGVLVTQRAGIVLLLVSLAVGLWMAPGPTAAGLFSVLILLNALNALARIAVLGAALRGPHPDQDMPRETDQVTALSTVGPIPCISILIPLLREPEVLPLLREALEALDWPPERLDVMLLLEQDDSETAAALAAMPLPRFCRTLVMPAGEPRTKPRALNIALDFARGDIIGIYDAEDRPEPDQLRRVAALLAQSPPEVACVQCRLSYYNPTENWLTRCFAIEYALWFDVLIAGFSDLGLPIPLGGTSVFFRRHALEALGGWDAHNVTEDADLGMRLARRGWRCAVSRSTTHEEANSRLLPWVRQRSRWLKGYITTWLVHMRRPVELWRDLGAVGFMGFQTVFLGAIVAYLGLPLFWLLWFSVLFGVGPGWLADTPVWLLWSIGVIQLGGWLAMLCAAVISTRRRGQGWLLRWVPTLVFYWPIGAIAAYVALFELLVAPTLWRKTRHGVGRVASAELDRVRRNAELAASDRASARSANG
jgi:cellulose synthase/poly-beta-1,6-N-acetylglucosamine synthase-like glycosyltransferase